MESAAEQNIPIFFILFYIQYTNICIFLKKRNNFYCIFVSVEDEKDKNNDI